MMIDPVSLLIKTTANYVAFKTVKSSVDYVGNRNGSILQQRKAVECPVCLYIWSNNPTQCPHCNYSVLKKLHRDYESRWAEEHNDGFEVNSNLTMGVKNDSRRI